MINKHEEIEDNQIDFSDVLKEELPELKYVKQRIDIKNAIQNPKKITRTLKSGKRKTYHIEQIQMTIQKKDNTKGDGKIVIMDLIRFYEVVKMIRYLDEETYYAVMKGLIKSI